ncbi:MAG: (2Fe-2S)-binding protein [Betaproteobacteria bacterium]
MTQPGDDEQAIAFHLNGEALAVRALPDEPLLYVLRDRLKQKGTRLGCGLNQCGACTVTINGRLQASCDTPMWAVEGKSVTTIEGLGAQGLHPVQQAMIEAQAGQCGFCLSGMVMALAQLLEQQSEPDEAAIRAALDGHLCRCGTHQRIVQSALRAAAALRSGPSP